MRIGTRHVGYRWLLGRWWEVLEVGRCGRADRFTVVAEDVMRELIRDLPDDVLADLAGDPMPEAEDGAPEGGRCRACWATSRAIARYPRDRYPTISVTVWILNDWHDGPRREWPALLTEAEVGAGCYERCCREYAAAAAELELRASYGPLLYAEGA